MTTRTYTRRQQHDPAVVARLVAGEYHPGQVSDADAMEAIRQLVLAGFSDGQAAHRARRHPRTVLRIRARLGLAPALPPGSNQNAWRVVAPTAHYRNG